MKLLMHACCAPCSVYCIDALRKEGIEPTIFWYNPNIHPFQEYKARRDCLIEYTSKIGVKLEMMDEYGLDEFCKNVADDLDGRCANYCYPIRLRKTFEYAKEHGYDAVSTTLLYSIYQKHDLIKALCEKYSEEYGVEFVYRDFRYGFWEGHDKATEEGLYMQKYCGCVFSEEDRYVKKKKDNLSLPEGFEWRRKNNSEGNMLEGIEVLCHSSIRFDKDKIIYFDPFKIQKNYNDADLIFITHSHYDHFSEEDILKVKNENTIIILTTDLVDKAKELGFTDSNIISVVPGLKSQVEGISFETIPAYNTNKKFHPKENNWVGYVVTINSVRYYIAGDTDINEDNKLVKCDVGLVPVGGTYTMTAEEAAELVNIIKPKIAVPIHYGLIVGTEEDAEKFKKLIKI